MDSRPPSRFQLNGSGEGPGNWQFFQGLVSFCKNLPSSLCLAKLPAFSRCSLFHSSYLIPWMAKLISTLSAGSSEKLFNYSGWATLCSLFSVADFHTRPSPNIPFQPCATCGAPAAEFLRKSNPGKMMAHHANSSQWRCHIEEFLACVSLPKA